MTRRTPRLLGPVLLALVGTLLAVPTAPATAHDGSGHDPIPPTGFQDREAIPGLSEPTGVAFAPDGTAVVAPKSGEIKSFE